MERVCFGIIGCGMIARFHIEAIQSMDQAELIGVYDPVMSAMQRMAKEYRVKMYSTDEELFRDSAVDAVCLCTPSGLHAPLAIRALKAGKHVVIEKPMALSLADADEIIRLSDETGKKVCVISQLRFSPAVQAVKQAMEDGAFGRLVSAGISMKYYRSTEYYTSSGWRGTLAMDGGGALMNQGIHGVDLLLYLAGDVRRLSSICRTQIHPIETEDTAAAVLEFDNGAVGTLEASTVCYPGYARRIELCGDQGSVILEEGNLLSWDLPVPKPDIVQQAAGFASDPAAIDISGHRLQLTSMVHAILYGKPLLVDARQGRRPVELILAVYEAARRGEQMEIRND